MEKINMKVQLSPKRIIPDVTTVWSEAGPEVDIVMDLKKLTFREGMISELYSFHVVDHLFPEEAEEAVKNWYKMLGINGRLHILSDDFEYIARAFVGGDIDIEMFNTLHNHPCQCTRESLALMMHRAGFLENETSYWVDDNAPEGMKKNHYELIVTGVKHGK